MSEGVSRIVPSFCSCSHCRRGRISDFPSKIRRSKIENALFRDEKKIGKSERKRNRKTPAACRSRRNYLTVKVWSGYCSIIRLVIRECRFSRNVNPLPPNVSATDLCGAIGLIVALLVRTFVRRAPVIVNCATRHLSPANDTIRWLAVDRYYISDGLIANKDLWVSCAPLAECESLGCPVTRVHVSFSLSFSLSLSLRLSLLTVRRSGMK